MSKLKTGAKALTVGGLLFFTYHLYNNSVEYDKEIAELNNKRNDLNKKYSYVIQANSLENTIDSLYNLKELSKKDAEILNISKRQVVAIRNNENFYEDKNIYNQKIELLNQQLNNKKKGSNLNFVGSIFSLYFGIIAAGLSYIGRKNKKLVGNVK